MTREQELRKAIECAGLSFRDYRILQALLHHADFGTAELNGKWQPRSLEQLAGWAQMSKSGLCAGLDSLEHLGWIKRGRHERPGRGQSTSYELCIGRSEVSRTRTLSEPVKASRTRTLSSEKASTESVQKGPELEDIDAGQTPVSVEGQRGEELIGGEVSPVPQDPKVAQLRELLETKFAVYVDPWADAQ